MPHRDHVLTKWLACFSLISVKMQGLGKTGALHFMRVKFSLLIPPVCFVFFDLTSLHQSFQLMLFMSGILNLVSTTVIQIKLF